MKQFTTLFKNDKLVVVRKDLQSAYHGAYHQILVKDAQTLELLFEVDSIKKQIDLDQLAEQLGIKQEWVKQLQG